MVCHFSSIFSVIIMSFQKTFGLKYFDIQKLFIFWPASEYYFKKQLKICKIERKKEGKVFSLGIMPGWPTSIFFFILCQLTIILQFLNVEIFLSILQRYFILWIIFSAIKSLYDSFSYLQIAIKKTAFINIPILVDKNLERKISYFQKIRLTILFIHNDYFLLCIEIGFCFI